MNELRIGICSFSFHRLLAEGKQDIFRYISDCKELGCTQLDPWNAHLADLKSGDEALHAGHNPDASQHLSAVEDDYIDGVRAAADAAGLPFGCIAVDGAHIYEPSEEARAANRQRAYRWLDVAQKLGAPQVRIDSGGPAQPSDEQWAIIFEGYRDIIDRAAKQGIEVLVENHWGPTNDPDNVLHVLNNVPGLGLLFDTNNWNPPVRVEAWHKTAHLAKAMHVKAFEFDAEGNELSTDQDVAAAIQLVKDTGYMGAWGVESVPKDGDEIKGAKDTIALIKRIVLA